MTDSITPTQNVHQVEVAIAGAGFGGLCMAIKLQEAGITAVSLGDRVLRWETAAVLTLGLAWWARQQP